MNTFLSRRRLASVIPFTAVLTLSCSVFKVQDKAFVANASAERLYQFDRYKRACVDVHGPATCRQMQTILNMLQDCPPGFSTPEGGCTKATGLIPLADNVYQVGTLPSQEKTEITKLLKKLRSLP